MSATGPERADESEEPPLPRGAQVARYVVVAPLGMGGMGVVYAAYDPALDRKIALKLLRARELPGVSAAEAQQRLAREAQALAKLSHPNVVAVHDVGLAGDRVFIALELVEGTDLRAWSARRRSWRETLEVLLGAGRGLGAAHAAGLVHRDFKPENVIVDGGGRARVLDFGLVRPANAAQPAGSGASLEGVLTEGNFGTPGFMAPEQLRGEPADARSDQFAFCVSALQCLLGERAFEAARGELMLGTVPARLARSGVPAAVLRPLAKGMSAAAQDRFASLSQLLDTLDRATRRRNTAQLAAVGAAAFVLASAAGALVFGRQAKVCGGSEEAIAAVVAPEILSRMHAQFLASRRPFAEASFAQTERALRAYAASWASLRRDSCEATRIRHEVPESLLLRKLGCLDERKLELEALVRVLAEADEEVVRAAPKAALSLAPLAECADAARWLAEPSAADPKTRAKVEAVRARAADAKARLDAGKYPEGAAIARAALTEARALRDPRLLSDMAAIAARLERKVGEPKEAARIFVEAELAAERGRDDVAATGLSAELAGTLLHQADYAGAEQWLDHGDATLARGGDGSLTRAHLLERRAELFGVRGRHDDGVPLLEHALALTRSSPGVSNLELAEALFRLATFRKHTADLPRALAEANEALGMVERTYGPDHPEVGNAIWHVTQIHRDLGQLNEALATAERALRIHRAALGDGHIDTANSRWDVADGLEELGRFEEAKAEYLELLPIVERAYGPEHLFVSSIKLEVAMLELKMGRTAAAAREIREAAELNEKALGKNGPKMVHAYDALGELALAQGRLDDARAQVKHAFEVARAANPANPDLQFPFELEGRILLALGKPKEAEASFRSALEVMDVRAVPSSPPRMLLVAELADALLKQGRGAEALTQAAAARTAIEAGTGMESLLLVEPLVVEAEARLALGEKAEARPLLARAAKLSAATSVNPSLRARVEAAARAAR